jgi:hypothetical protein
MAHYRLRMDDTLNIDADYNEGGADADVTYAIAAGFSEIASVDASTGVLTPAAPGLVVVEIKDANTSDVLKKLLIEVVSVDQAGFEADLADETASLSISLSSTHGSI